jgi:capsular exopolysaccharide synthesis family protein
MSDRLVPRDWTASSPGIEPLHGGSDPIVPEPPESVLGVVLEVLALIRRNFLLVLAFVLASFGGLAVMLHQERPTYRAVAVMRLVDKTRSMSGGLGTDASDKLGGAVTDPILSQLQILQSRGVAEGIAKQQGLQLRILTRGLAMSDLDSIHVAQNATLDTIRAEFSAAGVVVRMGESVARAAYGSPVSVNGVGFIVRSRPQADEATMFVTSLSAATDEVMAHLKSRVRDRTDIVDVSFEANDPARAQRAANSAVQVFQDVNAQASRQESVRRREFIEQQLDKTTALLSEAQLRHNAFQSREKVFSSQDKFKSQQADLTGLQVRRQELAADRQMYGGLLAALDSVPPGSLHDERLNALVSSPGIAANSVVAQLFGELLRLRQARDSITSGVFAAALGSPEVKRLDALIASTQANVVAAVRGQVSSADARIGALDELETKAASQLAAAPNSQAQEAGLLAEVDTYRQEADRLRDELQKAQIEEAADAGEVEIVDLAPPPRLAIGTGRRTKFAFALFVGLVLGATAAYILENYSPVIRRRADLDRAIAMPNLAVIPRNKTLTRADRRALERPPTNGKHGRTARDHGINKELVTITDARSNGAEAYRTLRTNLLFSSAMQSLKCIVISSPGPKEGKTLTAANLAIAFAQQGNRVLLVDCDLRRPRVHRMFNQPKDPGLTTVLMGGIDVTQAMQRTIVQNLWTLTTGLLPPNPVEMLGSPQMRALLRGVPSIDMIVLDTPPLLAASDAAVLGRIADGVVLVVRAGRTQHGAAQEAVKQLVNVGARVLGTVLNDPDAEFAKYAPYYHYYYNNYYDYSKT